MPSTWNGGSEPGALRLTPAELREVLALEATWMCLAPRRLPGFLEATGRRYGISAEDLSFFLKKSGFNRSDVWRLQVLKRMAEGNARAVEILGRLHRLELRRGEGLLQAYVRSRAAAAGR
jgi:hypothetical protein